MKFDSDTVTAVIQINTGIGNVRSDDTAGLKSDILRYLHFDTSIPLIPLIPPDEPNKASRGYHHIVTAKLLTPIEYPATHS